LLIPFQSIIFTKENEGLTFKLNIMEFKGTKGEWYSKVSGYKDYVSVQAVDNREGYKDRTILYDSDLDGNHCNDCLEIFNEAKANAKLIAASPKLLKALQKLLKDIDEREDFYYDVSEAEEAINKALN
jgi:hypothetical protein